MENFYDDFINREKYWFSQNDENDKYLSDNYGHLIDDYNYDIHCKPILGIMIYDQLTRHYYRKEQSKHKSFISLYGTKCQCYSNADLHFSFSVKIQ